MCQGPYPAGPTALSPPPPRHRQVSSHPDERRSLSGESSASENAVGRSLMAGDDPPLMPPVSATDPTLASRSESLPSPYPSGSNSPLSASTSILRATAPLHELLTRSPSTLADSPITEAPRRLPTPNVNADASSTTLPASREVVATSPRKPAVDQPTPRFYTIPRLLNAVDVELAPPPVMY